MSELESAQMAAKTHVHADSNALDAITVADDNPSTATTTATTTATSNASAPRNTVTPEKSQDSLQQLPSLDHWRATIDQYERTLQQLQQELKEIHEA